MMSTYGKAVGLVLSFRGTHWAIDFMAMLSIPGL
jgi:hypothetical protein